MFEDPVRSEAEIRHGSKGIMWARALLGEMGHTQLKPTILGEDNMSTITMINNDSNSFKIKHIEIRFNTCRLSR